MDAFIYWRLLNDLIVHIHHGDVKKKANTLYIKTNGFNSLSPLQSFHFGRNKYKFSRVREQMFYILFICLSYTFIFFDYDDIFCTIIQVRFIVLSASIFNILRVRGHLHHTHQHLHPYPASRSFDNYENHVTISIVVKHLMNSVLGG
jgi:hypothetical protein